MFIAARGIIGFGLGFNITAAPILIMELAFPTQKAPMVSIYNSLWSLGAIVAAWTTYGTFRIMSNWAWRIPSILQALSSIIQIFCLWWIVESPRWLVSKDRCDEAQAIITRVSHVICEAHLTKPFANQCRSIMPTAILTIRLFWWSSKRSKKLCDSSRNRQAPDPTLRFSKRVETCCDSSSFLLLASSLNGPGTASFQYVAAEYDVESTG